MVRVPEDDADSRGLRDRGYELRDRGYELRDRVFALLTLSLPLSSLLSPFRSPLHSLLLSSLITRRRPVRVIRHSAR